MSKILALPLASLAALLALAPAEVAVLEPGVRTAGSRPAGRAPDSRPDTARDPGGKKHAHVAAERHSYADALAAVSGRPIDSDIAPDDCREATD